MLSRWGAGGSGHRRGIWRYKSASGGDFWSFVEFFWPTIMLLEWRIFTLLTQDYFLGAGHLNEKTDLSSNSSPTPLAPPSSLTGTLYKGRKYKVYSQVPRNNKPVYTGLSRGDQIITWQLVVLKQAYASLSLTFVHVLLHVHVHVTSFDRPPEKYCLSSWATIPRYDNIVYFRYPTEKEPNHKLIRLHIS